MKKMLNEGNQRHSCISSSGSGTVINYGSGSDFLTSYSSGSGSTSQKVTVPTLPVPVPQRWYKGLYRWRRWQGEPTSPPPPQVWLNSLYVPLGEKDGGD
jgi:hypothetical protein